MKKRLYMLVGALVACTAICLSGCGSDKNGEVDTTTAAVTEGEKNTVENKTENKTEEPETEDTRVTYVIKVVDEEGNVMPSVNVQICKDSCIPAKTNEQGIAEFKVDEEADFKASIMVMPAGYELAGDETEFYFESGYEVTITLKKSN